jgi:hypothetical protein
MKKLWLLGLMLVLSGCQTETYNDYSGAGPYDGMIQAYGRQAERYRNRQTCNTVVTGPRSWKTNCY